jgi:hypothetical protein
VSDEMMLLSEAADYLRFSRTKMSQVLNRGEITVDGRTFQIRVIRMPLATDTPDPLGRDLRQRQVYADDVRAVHDAIYGPSGGKR